MFLFSFVTLTAQALNLLMEDKKYSLQLLKRQKDPQAEEVTII
jgi:hypothetical protein